VNFEVDPRQQYLNLLGYSQLLVKSKVADAIKKMHISPSADQQQSATTTVSRCTVIIQCRLPVLLLHHIENKTLANLHIYYVKHILHTTYILTLFLRMILCQIFSYSL